MRTQVFVVMCKHRDTRDTCIAGIFEDEGDAAKAMANLAREYPHAMVHQQKWRVWDNPQNTAKSVQFHVAETPRIGEFS